MAPAARLFARLGYPSLSDTALRHYLLVLYRKLYTPDGQRAAAAAAAAAKKDAAGADIAGVKAGAANPDSSDDSSGEMESDPDQPFGPKRRKMQPALPRSTSGGPASRPEHPPLTSRQELLLFMRWLNLTYDAMNKVQQVKEATASQPSAPSAPVPPTTAAAVPAAPSTGEDTRCGVWLVPFCQRLAGHSLVE